MASASYSDARTHDQGERWPSGELEAARHADRGEENR